MKTSDSVKAITGTAAVVGWFLLFGAGLLIDSAPYRQKIAAGIFDVDEVAATMCFYTL
jgi:hypothetical protein